MPVLRRIALFQPTGQPLYALLPAAVSGILLIALVIITASQLIAHTPAIPVGKATITSMDGRYQKQLVELPYYRMEDAAGTSLYDIELNFRAGSYPRFRLLPDDCVDAIRINGIDATGIIPEGSQCNYYIGFVINLDRYVHSGLNHIQVEVRNRGGITGLAFQPESTPLSIWLYTLLTWSLLLAAVAKATRCFGGDTLTMLAFACTWLIYLLQFYSIDISTFAHDYKIHMLYITSIVDYWHLPDPHNHIFAHNPLYHIISAVAHGLAGWFGIPQPFDAVRFVSLFLLLGFSLFGIATLRHVFSRKRYYFLALAIFLSWPLGFTLAGKINDDIAVYCFAAGLIYYLTRWEKRCHTPYLAMALLMCVCLILTKGGSILFIAITACTVALALYLKETAPAGLLDWKILSAGLLAMMAIAANLLRFYLGNTSRRALELYTDLPKNWEYNHLKNFAWLDLESFIRNPFSGSSEPGMEYFWNSFLNTLLFGEWSNLHYAYLASAISILLLCILAYTIPCLWRCGIYDSQYSRRTLFLPVITTLLSIAALMYFRFRFPTSHDMVGPTSDARYIYFIILPLCLLFVRAIEWNANNGRREAAMAGMAGGYLFAFCCLLFQALNVAHIYHALAQ